MKTKDQTSDFLALWNASSRQIYGFILSLLPNWSDADDAFQETGKVLWEKFDEFRPGSNFTAWARRIAYIRTMKLRCQKWRGPVVFSDAFADSVECDFVQHVETLNAQHAALAKCIEKLNPRDRALLESRYEEGGTAASAAARAGRSVNAVYKTMNRIHESLFHCVRRALRQDECLMEVQDGLLPADSAQALFNLAWAFRDDELTAEQAGRLQEIVRSNSAARGIYIELIGLLASLRWNLSGYNGSNLSTSSLTFHEESGADAATPVLGSFGRRLEWDAPSNCEIEGPEETMVLPALRDVPEVDNIDASPGVAPLPSPGRRRVFGRRGWWGIAASILLLCGLVVVVWSQLQPPPVAVLTATDGARWAGGFSAGSGSALKAGSLELLGGRARIKFNDGADVLLTAPARFELESEQSLRLLEGKLTAHVSGGSFTVKTPSADVVDLGTEFGVLVDRSGRAEVHVLVGQVRVDPQRSSAAQLLTANTAVRVEADGKRLTRVPARPEQFAMPQGQGASDESALLKDPSLVVQFTFTQEDGIPVVNPSGNTVDAVSRRLVFGEGADPTTIPTIVPGRRQGKPAIHFESDHATRCRLPAAAPDPFDFSGAAAGRPDPLTVAVWVRAEPTSEMGACIVTRGPAMQKQYSLDLNDGVFRFYLYDVNGKDFEVQSDIGPDGKWHHIAGTFDPARKEMKIYVDGTLRGSTQGPSALASIAGDLYIGSRPAVADRAYTLDGAIDEIALWRRALGGEEIASLYGAGK
jgi:RNA polymerase sigma-70 factor, ECF subfamily